MISINTAGDALSAGFLSAIEQASREWRTRLVDGNGNPLDCEIMSFTIHKGTRGQNYSIGTVYAPYFEAKITGYTGALVGQTVSIEIAPVITPGEEPTEYARLCKGEIFEAVQSGDAYEIKAAGVLALKGDLILTSTSTDVATVISALETLLGVDIEAQGAVLTMGLTGTLAQSMEGLTARTALQELACFFGGFVTETAEGNVLIGSTALGEAYEITGDMMLVEPEETGALSVAGFTVVVQAGGEDAQGQIIPADSYTDVVEFEKSGSIVTFEGSVNEVISSLKVSITPKQAGSGDPSPSNVRPISGWADADIKQGRENYNTPLFNGYISSVDGSFVASANERTTDYFPVEEGKTVFFNYKNNALGIRYMTIAFYDENKAFISRPFTTADAGASGWFNQTVPNGAKYCRCTNQGAMSSESILMATCGNTTPVPLGQTVYGGEVNPISGELVIDRISADLGAVTWQTRYTGSTNKALSGNMPSEYNGWTDNPEFIGEKYSQNGNVNGAGNLSNPDGKATGFWYLQNANTQTTKTVYMVVPISETPSGKAVYKLATPITVQLTPTEVRTLLGTNNVWSVGDVAITVTNSPAFSVICPYMTQEQFDRMKGYVTGRTIFGGTVEQAVGNPLLEPWDHILAGSSTFTGAELTITDAVSVSVHSEITTAEEKPTVQTGPMQAQIAEIQEALYTIQDGQQYFWIDSDGAHVTRVPKEVFKVNPAGGNALLDSDSVEFRNGSTTLADFGTSGASIGRAGEVRFFVVPSAIALTNNDGEAVFYVEENARGEIVRPVVVVTYASASDVSIVTYTISDPITAEGAVAVFFETGGDQYALDSTVAATVVTEDVGVTVALTQAGVDYCQELMTESSASGVLSAEYYIKHFDKALLSMIGSADVNGVGDIINVINTTWTPSNQSDTFIGVDNTYTGKGIRVGVGTGGQNRGLYDKTLERWIIYNNTDGKTIINGNNAVLSAGGNLTIDGNFSLRLKDKGIYLTDAQNKSESMIYINGSNAFSLGYGLYNASKGSTIIYGNDIDLRSKGDVNFNSSLILDTNNTAIFFTDTSGTKYSQIYLSNANNFVLGRYMHDANKGSTQVYGHTLGFHSHNAITFDQPISVNGNVNGRNMDALLYRGHFSTTSHTASNVTVAANTDSGAKTATFTRSGYYPYAIAGWNLTGENRMYQNLYEIAMTNRDSGTVTIAYRFRNNASVQVTIGLQVQILWIQIL